MNKSSIKLSDNSTVRQIFQAVDIYSDGANAYLWNTSLNIVLVSTQ